MRPVDAMTPRAQRLALVAGLTLARGQEEPLARPERRPSVEGEPLPEPVDVSLRLPTFRWLPREDFVDQVSLTRLPPGSLVIRYAGIHGFVVRRAQGRLRELWHDSIDDAWDAGILDDEGYDAELTRMYDALADFRAGGRWWDRSWQDSLVEGRGGAPAAPFEHQIGERIAFRLGPLILTNELRAYVERVAMLSVDPDAARLLRGTDPTRLAREHARLVRDDSDPEAEPVLEDGPEDPDDPRGTAAAIVRVAFEPPQPVLLRARWRLTLRPSVSFRTTGGPADLVRDARLRTRLELYLGPAQLKFLEVELLARYRPDIDEVTVALEVVLVTW